jgi:two-component system LytT family sensor kinase
MLKALSNFYQQKQSGRASLLQLFCWLAFIGYELFSLWTLQGYLEAWYIYLVHYALNILLFYGLLAVLPASYRTQRFGPAGRALAFMGLLAGYFLLKFVAHHLLTFPHPAWAAQLAGWRSFAAATFYRGGYFLLLATFYWAARHLADYARRLAEARSAYLQQQINPHLLFNTLNLIYTGVYQQSPAAARTVYLLAELMRFSLAETGPDGKVPLVTELEQLENLLEINRSRFSEPLYIETELPEPLPAGRVLPLILLTLTENIFKHGNLLDGACPALLRIRVTEDQNLVYYCRNLKKAKSTHAPLQQLGLHNTRVRLDLAYGGNYQLAINDSPDFFELTLTLPV